MTGFVKALKIVVSFALDSLKTVFLCWILVGCCDADTLTKGLDELDHITLGKIDYYKHTDYERDLLTAVVMKR